MRRTQRSRASSMRPDAFVVLQVTASLCCKIWGDFLPHGVQPGYLRHAACAGRGRHPHA